MIFIIIHHIIYQVVTPNFDNRMYACVDVFLHTAVIIFTRVRDKKRLEKVGNLVKNSYLYR